MNLKIIIKKVIRRLSKIINRKSDFLVQNKGKKIKECYICGEKFEKFYKFHINLERNEYLRKKIYSHDYKLFIFFDNYQFIIKLVFSPNMRKYKLQKLNDETDK